MRVAEKLAVSAVTAFRKRYAMLRKPGAAKDYGDELKLNEWIKAQEIHEKEISSSNYGCWALSSY